MFQALSFVKEGLIFSQCGKSKISYFFKRIHERFSTDKFRGILLNMLEKSLAHLVELVLFHVNSV